VLIGHPFGHPGAHVLHIYVYIYIWRHITWHMPLCVCLQICYLQINLMAINSKKHCVWCKKKTCIEATFLSAPNGSSCLEPAQHRQLLLARNSDGTRRPWLSCGHDVGKPGENRFRVWAGCVSKAKHQVVLALAWDVKMNIKTIKLDKLVDNVAPNCRTKKQGDWNEMKCWYQTLLCQQKLVPQSCRDTSPGLISQHA